MKKLEGKAMVRARLRDLIRLAVDVESGLDMDEDNRELPPALLLELRNKNLGLEQLIKKIKNDPVFSLNRKEP